MSEYLFLEMFFRYSGSSKCFEVIESAKLLLRKSMGSSEKFCLRWNDFERNISSAFYDFKEEKDFADVTLACTDGQIESHKVILAASSPFFKRVLKKNPHSHPLIYLKGIKSSDVEAVLNYMYHGEVNIEEANLSTFLKVAEELEVKGLVPSQEKRDSEGGPSLQSSASTFTKQVLLSGSNQIPLTQMHDQLSSRTGQESSTFVNNNWAANVKVETVDTFIATAHGELQKPHKDRSYHQEQCSQFS